MAKQRKSRAASLLGSKTETSDRVFPSKEETMKLVDAISGVEKESVQEEKKEKTSIMFSLRLSAHVHRKLKDKSERVGISMKSIIMNGLIKELDL